MKLCILLVLFGFCYCSKDGIMPVSYKSQLAEQKYHGYNNFMSNSDSGNHDGYGRNEEYMDGSESKYNEDVTKIDDYYEKYIGDKKSDSKHEDKNHRGTQIKFNEEDMKERLDEIFGYTGPTANDEPENLIRPCSLDDWQCLRKYLEANGKCKPAYGPIPDPLNLDLNTLHITNANITVTLANFVVRGLSSAKIGEFYVNKESGNLVIVLNIENLNEITPRAYFRYRRTAKESIVLAGFVTINFRAVIATVVIPKVPHLRLDLADVHVDLQEAVPQLFIAPEAALSADPDVLSSFAQLLANLPISLQESAFFQAPLFASIYIQTNLCDFGLKLISV